MVYRGVMALVVGAIVGSAATAAAAGKVWVHETDPNCAGNGTPGVSCFNAIQTGVRNAGPGKATVFVFPGSFFETVDLSEMGADVGGTPDAITLMGLTGVPMIVPASGRAIQNGVAPFPDDVTLENLHVTSNDADAINLDDVMGDVELVNVTAEAAAVDGVDIETRGKLTIEDSLSSQNQNDGFQLISGGNMKLVSVTADSNAGLGDGDDGFDIFMVDGKLTIEDCHALFNGNDGFEIVALPDGEISKVTIKESTAENNGAEGFEVNGKTTGDSEKGIIRDVKIEDLTALTNGGDGVQVQNDGKLSVKNVTSNGNDEDGLELGGSQSAEDLSHPSKAVVKDVTAMGNDLEGLEVHVDGKLTVKGCTVEENGSDGVQLKTYGKGAAKLSDCTAIRNGDDGIEFRAAGKIDVKDVLIEESGFGDPNEADDGLDLISTTDEAVKVTKAVANDNADDGVQVRTGGKVSLKDVTANGNGNRTPDPNDAGIGNGVLVHGRDGGNHPEGVRMSKVGAVGNAEDGIQARTDGKIKITKSCARMNGANGYLVPAATDDVQLKDADALDNTAAGVCLLSLGGTKNSASRAIVDGNGDGVEVQGVPATLGIDATKNWWGAASGPTHPDNAGGAGDSVVDDASGGDGDVDFGKFLTVAPTANAECQL